jgi:pyruvate formate lyase activating enzyme
MQGILSFVEERKDKLEEVHLLPYHRIAESKYARLKMEKHLGHIDEPDASFMKELSKKFETTGLKVSIGG